MSVTTFFLANGFALSVLLLILLVLLSSRNGHDKRKRRRAREDIQKIKKQIKD